MFKIFLSCSHKKISPEGEWGDARRAGGVGGFFHCRWNGQERGPISLEK